MRPSPACNGSRPRGQLLQRDLEAARGAAQKRAAEAAAATEAEAAKQGRRLEQFVGMSAAEMEEADDDEVEARMLKGMGLTKADMDALENMSDEEANAYLARRRLNTERLQIFAAGAPQVSDAPKLDRLTREFGD